VRRKRFSVEQIVGVLKQAEVGMAVVEVCRQAGITEQTFYRWKKQYVGLETDHVRQLKQLREENTRLKRLVAELSLDKTILQDVLAKNCKALAPSRTGRLSARRVPGELEARLPSGADSGFHLSVPEHPGAENGAAVAESGDRPSPNPLRLPEDSGAAEA
jgi:putative transposase